MNRGKIVSAECRLLVCCAFLVFLATSATADTTATYTGTLASSTDTVDITLTLSSAANVTLQSFGFGGGTDGTNTFAADGTDPFLAVFSGTGAGATILTDGMGNVYATASDLANYSSFMGCPPAGYVSFGGLPTCGDITMSIADLAAGTYTIVLSDGSYIAEAYFEGAGGMLGDGFVDFTGGVFCNIQNSVNGAGCPDANSTGNYALDVTTSPIVTNAPEPATLPLLALGLLGFGAIRSFRGTLRRAA
jgi:hypothetical protein